MLTNLSKPPFIYFGGKTDAAPAVWAALGDVPHYVEPFMGGLAVLLHRPHPCNRTYFSETVNDLDGLLCNAWRAIQWKPDATAEAASWPVCEADMHARHLAILRWKAARELEHLMGDPEFCDPVIAGYWMWGICSWIGSGWCSGNGPWVVGDDGRIARRSGENGVKRQLPHLGDNGQGVNHAGTREPGVSRQLPHLGNDGRGVNRPQLREPGVSRPDEAADDGREFHPPVRCRSRSEFCSRARRDESAQARHTWPHSYRVVSLGAGRQPGWQRALHCLGQGHRGGHQSRYRYDPGCRNDGSCVIQRSRQQLHVWHSSEGQPEIHDCG